MRLGEFRGEPLIVLPGPGDPCLAWVGLLPGGPDGGPPFLEFVLEVTPGPMEGRAGDLGLAGERLDVAGPARRDLPYQQPIDGGAGKPLDLFTLFGVSSGHQH
ncbi:hypothetical protein ASD48_20350 [Streptomyces sp. Root1310]|nr:hypothetical protein ASD48_20350 [Streptomyces sp. Root1310]